MTKKRTENSFVVEWKDGRLRLVASRGAARQLLLAALLVMAAVFVICAFVIAVAPEQTAAATQFLFHIDLSSLVSPISWGGFFAGLVVFSVFMAAVAGLWGSIYNRFAH